jgi:hypothetical protein
MDNDSRSLAGSLMNAGRVRRSARWYVPQLSWLGEVKRETLKPTRLLTLRPGMPNSPAFAGAGNVSRTKNTIL